MMEFLSLVPTVDPCDTYLFAEAWYSAAQRPPLERLALAVLWEALEDLTRSESKREDALRWFHEGDESWWLFSFPSICATAGLDQRTVLAYALSLTERPPGREQACGRRQATPKRTYWRGISPR